MADIANSLSHLSESQREALEWLSRQQGTEPVDPPSEHRTQTWKSLASRGMVAIDSDGNVAMRPAGRVLFAEDEAPATVEAPAEGGTPTNSEDPAVNPGAIETAPVVESSIRTGSPSADQVAAEATQTPNAGTGGPGDPTAGGQPEMAGEVEANTGEDPNPAPAPQRGTPVHEQSASRLGDLRSGMRGVDPELGVYRVLGEPEKLWGTNTGKVRVPVMRVDNGRREYLRGEPGMAITQE